MHSVSQSSLCIQNHHRSCGDDKRADSSTTVPLAASLLSVLLCWLAAAPFSTVSIAFCPSGAETGDSDAMADGTETIRRMERTFKLCQPRSDQTHLR